MPVAESQAMVETCVSWERLGPLRMDTTLDMFRKPEAQKKALLAIAKDGGCVTIAIDGDTLIGYAAFHRPSEVESWGEDRTGKLIELGAVEVSEYYRGQKLAEKILIATFETSIYDDTIVFATMYFWH